MLVIHRNANSLLLVLTHKIFRQSFVLASKQEIMGFPILIRNVRISLICKLRHQVHLTVTRCFHKLF